MELACSSHRPNPNPSPSPSPNPSPNPNQGGVIEGFVNITSRAAGDGEHWAGQVARSKGTSVPELAYITAELRRRDLTSAPS